MESGLDEIKKKMRDTWTAGDFGQIARYSAESAKQFVASLGIRPGDRVLDVACGTGNLALPAARAGAQVSGIDIAPNLLEQARSRAETEGLKAVFEEGDAEQLPYADGSFDFVMSMFGAIFAPSPEKVSRQMTRVCRTGGTVAMANWTGRGFVGKLFAVNERYIPAPPDIPAPRLWGEEDIVRQRLGSYSSKIETLREILNFDFPFPPPMVAKLFLRYFGPAQMALARLSPEQRMAYTSDFENLWQESNVSPEPESRTLVPAEYLAVKAIRS